MKPKTELNNKAMPKLNKEEEMLEATVFVEGGRVPKMNRTGAKNIVHLNELNSTAGINVPGDKLYRTAKCNKSLQPAWEMTKLTKEAGQSLTKED